MKDVLLIVGNGFSIDLYKKYTKKLNPSAPLSWEFKINQNPTPISWQDAFPKLNKFSNENLIKFKNDNFELFRKARLTGDEDLEVEARHFLSLAYTHHDQSIYVPRVWQWSRFIKKIYRRIHTAISFNYDTTLEQILYRGTSIICDEKIMIHGYHDELITVFKPHGCRRMDVDPRDVVMDGGVKYPINIQINRNDMRYALLPHELQLSPRKQSFCILPYENNIFQKHQWQNGIWELLKEKNSKIKHCVVIGHSYGDVDRPEIDAIINSLPGNATVHVCDPSPSNELIRFLDAKNMNYKLYTNRDKTPDAIDFI